MFVAGCRSSAPRSPAWASATAPRRSSRPGRRPRRPDRSPDHRAPAQPRPARPPYPGRPERPPPPLRRERRPAPPRPRGYVWTNGYWRWPGGRSVWIPGRWNRAAPRASLDPRLLATTGRRAALYRRTLELRARRAARRLPRKPRNASGNARRRRIAADEHRAPVFGAAICRTPLRAREGGPKMNQRRGKRARTPAAARGFLTTAPTDAIASIAGFHRP
ncbi:YXWGXW repeat-containing protein [Burkholderia pseudomallei]|uniref:YXWGXW repeat-containing protein n=1 Tax=Burkholderia pseudomallei TaxID=28450 RepID=UPI00311E2DFA